MIIKKSIGESSFDILNYLILLFLAVITIYPFIYILFASVSNAGDIISSGGILLWPKGFNLGAYKLVFENPNIILGYSNTIFYVMTGTLLSVLLTLVAAYGLSRKWLYGRNTMMLLITFTMFFHGGLIPSYLVVKNLHLIDTRLALLLPNAVLVWNIIITRTFFLGIPESMEESAKLDGANDFIILFKIMIPLAMSVVAVNILFYAVGYWNAWFNALIYIRNRSLYPLQMFLREILIQAQVQNMDVAATDPILENVKYATIIVATLPILCLYPFIQKYFMQGIMVGAIKG